MAASLDFYTNNYSFSRGTTRRNDVGKPQLQKALAAIDGLFAGLNYLDRVEPSTSDTYDTQSPSNHSTAPSWNSSDVPEDSLSDELESLATTPQTSSSTRTDGSAEVPPRLNTQTYDWSSIRNVRDGMEVLWQKFDSAVEDLNSMRIRTLREFYGTSRTLRETGVFAYRNTLTGPKPSNLEQVFAFTSLAYVVQSLLHEKRRIGRHEILDGVHLWMNAINDEDERQLFRDLAQRLWPEAENRLHFIPLPSECGFKFTPSVPMPQQPMSCHTQFPAAQTIGNAASQVATNQFSQGHTSAVSDFPSMHEPNFPLWPSQDQIAWTPPDMDMTQVAYKISDYASSLWRWDLIPTFDGIAFPPNVSKEYQYSPWDPFPNQQPKATNWQPNQPTSANIGAAPSGTTNIPAHTNLFNETPVRISELRETKMFLAIQVLIEILGELPYLLSGGRLTARSLEAFNPSSWEQHRRTREIYELFLEPMERSKAFKAIYLQALIFMAKQFVRCGHLQTIEGVRAYLIAVGKEVLRPGDFRILEHRVLGRKTDTGNRRQPIGKGKHRCETCGLGLSRANGLKRHLQRVHRQTACV